MGLRFSKMHGAGNDFVVLDRRHVNDPLSAATIARLCDRHRGIGCDQLLTIEAPRTEGSAFAYGIWNQDGSRAGQCGNGARCVVAWAQREGLFQGQGVRADSPSGPIDAEVHADGIEIGMGRPDFLGGSAGFTGGDTPSLHRLGRDWPFTVVSMGNPHAVIEVDDVSLAPVQDIGPALQRDARFADRCNVGFVQLIDRGQIALRVFERGVGETLACGSGACAAMASLRRADRVDADVRVVLPGGTLRVTWNAPDAPIRMRGPAEFVFEGELPA
jgi:diaminopimelate epimerase